MVDALRLSWAVSSRQVAYGLHWLAACICLGVLFCEAHNPDDAPVFKIDAHPTAWPVVVIVLMYSAGCIVTDDRVPIWRVLVQLACSLMAVFCPCGFLFAGAEMFVFISDALCRRLRCCRRRDHDLTQIAGWPSPLV